MAGGYIMISGSQPPSVRAEVSVITNYLHVLQEEKPYIQKFEVKYLSYVNPKREVIQVNVWINESDYVLDVLINNKTIGDLINEMIPIKKIEINVVIF